LHKVKSFWLLPGPEITFRGAQAPWSGDSEYWFSLLGGGEDRILFAAVDCQTALYNADLKGIAPMPKTHSRKGPNPICLSMPQADHAVSQSLYVLDKSRDTCFEVLARTGNDTSLSTKDWCWHTLEQPPFRFDRNFELSTNMYPHSVVDSRTICVSSSLEDEGIGSPIEGTHLFENSKKCTYMYDTVSNVWREAGDWVLPFFGKAEYVPELHLWFGLTTCKPSYRLCAFDLSAVNLVRPPMPQHACDVFDLTDERPASRH
jgi:hypothetical protein